MFNLLSSYSTFSEWFYSSEFVFGIQKYAICILTGIIIAYFVCTRETKRMGFNSGEILDAMIVIVPLAIIGARIWYMLGDGDPTFKDYMNEYGFFKAIFYTIMYTIGFTGWPSYRGFNGLSGLAIHGGIVIAFAGAIIWCSIKKWKINRILDCVMPGLFIGQICGRWGNFFNQEAHGGVVGGMVMEGGKLIPNLTLAEQEAWMKSHLIPNWIAKNMLIGDSTAYYGPVGGNVPFSTTPNYFHPTFLYELLLNGVGLALYFVIRRVFKKQIKSGFFVGFYLIWYGIIRFFIEYTRTDSLYVGNTTIKSAQLTSIIMIVLGVLYILYLFLIKKGETYEESLVNMEPIKSKKNEQKEQE